MFKKNKKLLLGLIVTLLIIAVITATAVYALSFEKVEAILSDIVNNEGNLEENDINGDRKVDVLDAIFAIRQDISSVTKLTAQYSQKAATLSRLTASPVNVEIGSSGVDISLNYLAWPTVVRDENGTLYAGASLRRSHVDPFGAIAFYVGEVSEDGNVSWSEPQVIYDSPVDDRDVGLVYLGDGKMVATFFTIGSSQFLTGDYKDRNKYWGGCTDDQRNAKIESWNDLDEKYSRKESRFVIISNDYGKKWSDPIEVPFSSPHGPSLMKDGTLICPNLSDASGGTYKEIFSTYISTDCGITWTKQPDVRLPELPSGQEYSEPYVIQLSDGSFLAGVRSEESGVKGSTYSIWTMKSLDGINWTTAKKIPGVVGAPAHFLELSNGAILLTYSYRVNPNRGVRGRISYDGGLTWDTEELVLSSIYYSDNDIDKIINAYKIYKQPDLGYPSTVELDDGTLITVYYQAANKSDSTASLLYTKWELLPAD